MVSLALLLILVFALNVLPAFAPPTWMVISFVGLKYPDSNPWLVALVAAVAATGGRLVLAHYAQRIVASRWVGSSVRDNLEVVAAAVQRRKTASVLAFLAFAFSPLPSNALFIAYGLTRAPLHLLVVPFFVGRLLSYAGAFAGGTLLSRWFEPELDGPAWWVYFLGTQVLWLGCVYAFAKIDWRRSGKERRVRLLKIAKP